MFYLRQLIDIWTYHIKFAGKYFYWFVTIFSKNRAILVHKLGEICQYPFPAILRLKKGEKNPNANMIGGGGGKD